MSGSCAVRGRRFGQPCRKNWLIPPGPSCSSEPHSSLPGPAADLCPWTLTARPLPPRWAGEPGRLRRRTQNRSLCSLPSAGIDDPPPVRNRSGHPGLTEREREVLDLICARQTEGPCGGGPVSGGDLIRSPLRGEARDQGPRDPRRGPEPPGKQEPDM